MAKNERPRGRSNSRETSSEEEKELWEELEVNFRLEAVEFPDDKIYGRMRVTPESSRQLIKTFKLFVDRRSVGDLHAQASHVSASGFSSTKEGYRYAHIEAVPWTKSEHIQNKFSQPCRFFFKGHSFYANPKITFERSDYDELARPAAVIKWRHLGDSRARRYLLYLDEKLIQQVQEFTDDALVVKIHDLKVGDKHVFELAATGPRNKETYRSDPLEFIVPESSDCGDEIINVREDRMPANLPVVYSGDEDVTPQPPLHSRKIKPKETSGCCDLAPHETFPGIEHYFRPIRQPPSSNRL